MKVDIPVKEITVSQTQLAEAFDVSRSRINQLANDNIVIRDRKSDNGDVLLFESLEKYFSQQDTQKTVRIPIKEIAVTQKQMAQALDLGTTRINQLADEGIIVRDETSRSGRVMLFESLRNFFMNRTGETNIRVNFNDERALYMKAKRELAELKLSKAKEEVINAADMEKNLMKLFAVLRTKLLALPSSLALQLEGKEHHAIYEILSSAIEETLLELSTFDFSKTQLGNDDE